MWNEQMKDKVDTWVGRLAADPVATGCLALRDIAEFDALTGATFHDILPGMSLYGRVTGVLVGDVEGGSKAQRLGLQPGDIVMGVNQRGVGSLEDLAAVLGSANDAIALTIRRGNGTLFLFIG